MNQNKSNGRERKLDRVRQRCITLYKSQDEALKEANINLSAKVQWLCDTFLIPTEIAPQFQPNAERIFISETEGVKDYLRKNGEDKTIDYVRKMLDDRLGIPVTLTQARNFYNKWKHLVQPTS
jgi:hypothetical protein